MVVSPTLAHPENQVCLGHKVSWAFQALKEPEEIQAQWVHRAQQGLRDYLGLQVL